MNSDKVTKRAFTSSLIAMLICVAMLVGTTFAWFTDSASTAVNQVVSGTLDVALVDATGASIEGQSLAWVKAAGHEAEATLWEPGCTYTLPAVYIKNNGNLALKYTIAISGVDGDARLLDAITWTYTVNGEVNDLTGENHLSAGATSGAIVISGHMREDAGNEYQGLSIEGIGITVSATQYTEEYDSNNNTYDANAQYISTVVATSSASFADALDTLSTTNPVAINLTEDVSGITGIKTENGEELTVNLGSHAMTVNTSVGSSGTETSGMQLLKGSAVTLKNGTYKPEAGNNTVQLLIQNYSDLTLDSVTLDARDGNVCAYALSTNCGKVVIKGNTNIYTDADETALDIMHWENAAYNEAGSHVVIDSSMTGTVDGLIAVYCYNSANTPKSRDVDDGGATLVIMGGTFINSGLTLTQFSAYVPDGYAVTTNADGSFTVHAA